MDTKKSGKAEYVKPEIKKHEATSVVAASLFSCTYYRASYLYNYYYYYYYYYY
ncbi:MAG: hypothetical protein PHI34_05960 [Acidobacteriota bacterium]|jgi:hypothetical protein|nr:hypothetical protein [Acidobacteriota bacterium]